MNTPWGKADGVEVLERGISKVYTPGHGGLMIAKGYAMRNLSRSAIDRGQVFGSYLAYEEDCDWAIPMFELRHLWPIYFRPGSESAKDPYGSMLHTLSYYNADYLLEIGVTPEPKAYAVYEQRRIEGEMRQAKSPHLIVAAWGSWDTKIPGVIRVATANGREYHITESSYKAAQASGQILDIDNMEIVRTL